MACPLLVMILGTPLVLSTFFYQVLEVLTFLVTIEVGMMYFTSFKCHFQFSIISENVAYIFRKSKQKHAPTKWPYSTFLYRQWRKCYFSWYTRIGELIEYPSSLHNLCFLIKYSLTYDKFFWNKIKDYPQMFTHLFKKFSGHFCLIKITKLKENHLFNNFQ